MPVFEIEGGDGKTYDVDAPNPQSAAAAIKKMGGFAATALDVASTIPSKLTQGTMDLIGLPGDVGDKMLQGSDWLVKKLLDITPPKRGPRMTGLTPTSAELKSGVESFTGPLYEPQTNWGRYAGAAARFAPAALAGPGGVARNLARYAVAPGLAFEGATDVAKGTPLEPYAGPVGAVAGMVAGHRLTRPGTASGIMQEGMGAATTPQVVEQAGQLIEAAAQRGITLTWPEAIQQITNSGTKLADVQRVVENSQRGGAIMKPALADRPQQMAAAVDQQVGQIAPNPMNPYTIGPRVSEAATGTIQELRQAINAASEPYYTAAATTLVAPARFATVQNLPGWQEALAAVRNNPQLNRHVANLPDDSVGVLNAVKKQLDQHAENMSAAINPGRNVEAAAGAGTDAAAVRNEAIAATGGPGGSYDRALEIQRQLRQSHLEPMQQGPVGQAARAGNTEGVVDAMLPQAPLANSEQAIGQAFRQIGARDPQAASNVIGQRVATTANQAMKDVQGGANEWSGAAVRAALYGNAQKRRNLVAAIGTLPGGQQIQRGLDQLMEILQATGRRHRPNSMTEMNRLLTERLQEGGLVGEVISGTSKYTPATFVRDRYQKWRYGQNSESLARLMLDPQSRALLLQLARMNPRSTQATVFAAELSARIIEGERAPATATGQP